MLGETVRAQGARSGGSFWVLTVEQSPGINRQGNNREGGSRPEVVR